MDVTIPIGNIIAIYLFIGVWSVVLAAIITILDLDDISTQARKHHFIKPARLLILWPIMAIRLYIRAVKWFWHLEP